MRPSKSKLKVKDWYNRISKELYNSCTYLFPETMKVLEEMRNELKNDK